MANKESVAIELKEISARYPSLQDEPEDLGEERKTINPQSRSQVRNLPAPPVSRSSNSNVTPVVPVTTTAPGPSFLEQQRLRNSMPGPNNLEQPNLRNPVTENVHNQGQGYIQRGLPQGFSAVQCSGCRGMIQYPTEVSIVCCTACRATTATKPLINIVCHFCKNSAYYPANYSQVRCRCGTVYAVRPA
jgi:LSD1 subclass zinc finger protein